MAEKRLCKFEGCVNICAQSYCPGHRMQVKRGGVMKPLKTKNPYESYSKYKSCLVGNCDRPVSGRGFCNSHYQQIRSCVVVTPEDEDNGLTPCVVPGCRLLYYAKGMCKMHYGKIHHIAYYSKFLDLMKG